MASGSLSSAIVHDMKADKRLWSATYEAYLNDLELIDELLFICNENIPFPVLNLKSFKIEFEIELEFPCREIEINKDKTIMAIATEKNIILWDYQKKHTIKEMVVGDYPCTLKFNPEGNRLLIGLYDGSLIKIDIEL